MPTELVPPEGNMEHDMNRKTCPDPARSETLSMQGSDLHRSWETSTVPEKSSGGAGKVHNHKPAINAGEESDASIVPKKPPNKGKPAEAVEGRGAAKGNVGEDPRKPNTESANE